MSSGGGGWPPGDADGYGNGGRYRGDEFGANHDQGQYPDEPGYEWSEASGRSQGDPYARGRTDQYGQSMGGHSSGHSAPPSYDQDGYGQRAYRQDPYGDSYGQGRQPGSDYAGDQHGRDGYAQSGYGQAGYGEPGYGRDGYGRDPGADRYGHGSYAPDGYAQDGYGQDGYAQAGHGGEYYGQVPPGRALPAPDGSGGDGYGQDGPSTDSYGREHYGQNGYGSTASYQAAGGYQPRDDYGHDNGYFGQPSDTGSFGRPDTGSFGRPDTGSFGRPDTGSFGRPDTGSFGATDGYLSGGQPDPFGPPAASLRRSDLSGGAPSRTGDDNSPFGVRQDAGHAGGFDQWHDAADDADGWGSDDAAEQDGDWQDDDESGLLSRRFGNDDDGGRGSGRGSGRRAARIRRPKRLRGKFALIAAILAGALVFGAVADFGYERFAAWHKTRYGNYLGQGTGQVRFLVQSGSVLSSLGPALMKQGVIEEVRPFESAAAAAPNASHLQPGIYLLHRHMNSALAVQYLLSSAHLINDKITIIEGTRASAIAQALAKQTGKPVRQFTDIIDHPPASLGLPSWAAGKTAEGFLFPDTYSLLPNMTALQILQMMVTEFKHQVGAINLVGRSKAGATSPWHALIVASLIQAEAGSTSDFGKISRVVWNRLRVNMPLQFDSTVFYAMGTYGTHVKNARQQNFPSPYNTYLHTGLPPGPIGNPGVATMEAAVHATHGPWLYFITDTRHKPYITHFTASLSQLQAWQREFKN